MAEWVTYVLWLLVMIELAFMVVFVVLTSARLADYDDREASRAMVISSMISTALSTSGVFRTLRTYTLMIDFDASTSVADPTVVGMVNLKSTSYNIYLNQKNTSDGSTRVVALSSVVARIPINNVELLVFKDISAGQSFVKDASTGAIAYVVVGGRTFMLLQFNGLVDWSSVTQDSNAIVVPVVAFVASSFTNDPTMTTVVNPFSQSTAAIRLTDVLDLNVGSPTTTTTTSSTTYVLYNVVGF